MTENVYAELTERFYAKSMEHPRPRFFTITYDEAVSLAHVLGMTREWVDWLIEHPDETRPVLFGIPVRIRPLRAFALHV